MHRYFSDKDRNYLFHFFLAKIDVNPINKKRVLTVNFRREITLSTSQSK